MKIFPRYIASQFWGPFLFGLGIFAVLVFLADTFEHLNTFMKSQAEVGAVLKYLLLRIPYWTLKVVPVATLLAVLFSLSGLVHTGEWKAGLAGGYRPPDMLLPIAVCSLIITAGTFLFQEAVIPPLHFKAEKIYYRDIKKSEDWRHLEQENVTLSAGGNRFISAHGFNAREGTMNRVVMDVYKNGRLARQLDALSARWDTSIKSWFFLNGVERLFQENGGVEEKTFESRVSDLGVAPGNLVLDTSSLEELTARQTLRRLRRLRKLGASNIRERVMFHTKLSFPFSNLVMCLLGIPFALLVRKSSHALNFTAAVVAAFVFWWVTSIGQAAGESGLLSAPVAAWGPIAIFAAAGVCGLKKAGILS
ncbi:MAG: LptF/LptG family permease [bacterium]